MPIISYLERNQDSPCGTRTLSHAGQARWKSPFLKIRQHLGLYGDLLALNIDFGCYQPINVQTFETKSIKLLN